MPWQNVGSLTRRLEADPHFDQLSRLYHLRTLLSGCLFPEGYVPPTGFADSLRLSEHAKEIIATDPSAFSDVPIADLHVAAFKRFFHHDVLIDIEESNVDDVIRLVDQELTSLRVRLPYRFGRQLYDRFNDTVQHERTEHIDADQVASLLNDAPQGVYQVGHYLTGGLGLLVAPEPRFVPPVVRLPLWHCSDTGCNALHNVTCLPPGIAITRAETRLTRLAADRFGPPSEWVGAFRNGLYDGKWSSGRPCHDLAALIGDCILEKERTALLIGALDGPTGATLRDILRRPPRKRRHGDGPTDKLAASLSPDLQLQLLLCLEDDVLVDLIDRLVLGQVIRVPVSEVRRAVLRPPAVHSTDMRAELSMFGIRAARQRPFVSLALAIWDAHDNKGLLGDLAWRVQKRGGTPMRRDLMEYMREQNPRDIIRNLVLPSLPIATRIAEQYQMTILPEEDDERLLDRFLWKVGFDAPRFADNYSRFEARLTQFNDVLLRTGPVRNEDDREAIRSAGVNLFVSVEEFLEELVAYNVWLLASDHFVSTRFAFDMNDALQRVSEVIGSNVQSGEQAVAWSPVGGNTLGTSMSYLSAARDWLVSRSLASREAVARPERDLPHYADMPEQMFLLRHTELWADADPLELKQYTDGLVEIVQQIERSNLAFVRNGLDHKRDDARFPTTDAMLACCARLREALQSAVVKRYLPIVLWLLRREADRFGRVRFIAADYVGRTVTMYGPSPVSGLPSAKFSDPVLVPGVNLLGQPNADLIFRVSGDSIFARYWSGYPRRRRIPPEQQSVEH